MTHDIKTSELSLGFLTVGEKFLHLAELSCLQLVKSGNPFVVVRALRKGEEVKKEFPEKEYLNATKWSDTMISIPVLFNFYHGMELILKAFITLIDQAPTKHRLTKLLADFEKHHLKTTHGHSISKIIAKYTCSLDKESPLGKFFETNKISPDDWYQALKYPESTGKQTYSHYDLKYGSSNTIDFWKSISKDAHCLKIEAVKLSRICGL